MDNKIYKTKIKSLFKRRHLLQKKVFGFLANVESCYKDDFKVLLLSKCGSHHKLSCGQRFKLFFDDEAYEIIKTPVPSDDPLNFVDNKKYIDRLRDAEKNWPGRCSSNS